MNRPQRVLENVVRSFCDEQSAPGEDRNIVGILFSKLYALDDGGRNPVDQIFAE